MRAARQLLAAAAGVASLVIVVPVALVLLPMWAVASLARLLARWIEPPILDWRAVTRFEEAVGWVPRPHLEGHVRDFHGDPFRLTTDAEGWRAAATLEESDLVVLGDSYAFGYGVDDDAFFARHVPGHRVSAIGAPGYGMAQPVLWLERLAGTLSGKTVVWLVYVGNDLIETLLPASNGHRSPFVAVREDGSCELVTRHVRPDPWTMATPGGMDAYIDVCSPGRLSRRAFAACEYLVERAAGVCESAGAELVVMTVPEMSPAAREALESALDARSRPETFDEDRPERRIAEICDQLGVRRVALREHMGPEHYLEHDFHWNPAGHRRLAEVLAAAAAGNGARAHGAPPSPRNLDDDLAVPAGSTGRSEGARSSAAAREA